MKTCCMAVFAPLGNDLWATGAGFLVRAASSVWLMTAAHNPTQAQPTHDFTRWPDNIHLKTPRNEACVPLFSRQGPFRAPRFLFRGQGTAFIEDVLALQLHPNDLPQGMRSEVRPVIDLSSPQPDPAVGTRLVAHGFPQRSGMWPYWPADIIEGHLEERKGRLLYADMPAKVGHSGGPVFDSGGKFVGMLIGRDPCTLVPQDVLADFMASGARSISLETKHGRSVAG